MKNYITIFNCQARHPKGWTMGTVLANLTFISSGELKEMKVEKEYITHIQFSSNRWIPLSCVKLTSIQNPPTSDSGDFIGYARVRHYIEMPPHFKSIVYHPDTKIAARFGGIPSVMQRTLISDKKNKLADKPVKMTQALKDWSFHLLELTAPKWMTKADIYNAWYHLYTSDVAFANKAGVNSIYGFYLQQTISHGTPWLKVLRTFSKYNEVQAAYEIADAFDIATLNISPLDPATRHLLMPAVNWSKGWINEKHDVDPLWPQGYAEPFSKLGGSRDWFPEQNNFGGTHFVPMLGNHTREGYIPLKWLELLGKESVCPPTPYWKKP